MPKCSKCGKFKLFDMSRLNGNYLCPNCYNQVKAELEEKEKRDAQIRKEIHEAEEQRIKEAKRLRDEAIHLDKEKQLAEELAKQQEEKRRKEEAERLIQQELEEAREEAWQELNEIPSAICSGEPVKEFVRYSVTEEDNIKYSSITARTSEARLYPLVVLDVETTGIKISGTEIIEIGAIKYIGPDEPAEKFSTLIKPKKPIPWDATRVNSITDDMVKDAPSIQEVIVPFGNFIENCNIVGHNLPFDIRHLLHNGVSFSPKVRYFDTLSLAQKYYKAPQRRWDREIEDWTYDYENADVLNYKLPTLCEYFGIVPAGAHRAICDCQVTYKVFQKIIRDVLP